jgi:hypothetical protein
LPAWHDIGQFFLLARVWEYPEMLSDESPLSDLVRVWHARSGGRCWRR